MRSIVAALAAGIALLGMPGAASATSAESTYDVRTRIVEQMPGVGEYDGSLQLRVSPDGVMTGFYRPDENPRFVPITGGVTGDRFWIEIGTFARDPMRFSGTFSAGHIDAQSNGLIRDNGHTTGLNLTGTPIRD